MTAIDYTLLFIGGIMAGVINTLAGNGSAITLSLMIFMGMPANVANATNRIGALIQTLASVLSLRKTPRTKLMFQNSRWFFIPSILGSSIGAMLAIDIDPQILRFIIGGIMLLLLFTLLYNPKKWLKATDLTKTHKTKLNWILIFIIALYGGFIQMGIGIMMLSVLVLLVDYSLRDANIIKLVLAFVFMIPAFIVFFLSGDMEWMPGLALAAGQAIGAIFGARYVLFMPKANTYVRWLLIVILSISAIVMLELPALVISLLSNFS